MRETICLIALSRVTDIGPVTLRSIISHLGSAEAVFGADYRTFKAISGVGEKRAQAIDRAVKGFEAGRLQEELAGLKETGVRAVTYLDKDYPPALREIPAPPCVLYIK